MNWGIAFRNPACTCFMLLGHIGSSLEMLFFSMCPAPAAWCEPPPSEKVKERRGLFSTGGSKFPNYSVNFSTFRTPYPLPLFTKSRRSCAEYDSSGVA